MQAVEFHQPLLLLLLPLALLPMLPGRRDTIPFPWIHWLPADAAGIWLHRAWLGIATLTLALLVVGLAGPEGSDGTLERIGRGAEIGILLDRSASMDSQIRRRIRMNYQEKQTTRTKNEIATEALSWLLAQRPENRYALTMFHIVPMRITEFTSDVEVLSAGLKASAVGRGAKETNMGSALLAAIKGFEQRPYTGSRALLLVSDGGAKIDKPTRQRIRQGLRQHQISLYFIYVQSGTNNADFEADYTTVGTDTDGLSDEVALHLFFKNLGTEYQVFQAHDEQSFGEAIAIIDAQQNLPLTYYERIPGIDYSGPLFVAALIGCAMLASLSVVRLVTLA